MQADSKSVWQAAPLAPPGANVEQLRIAAQLAHHQAELAQAQMLALPPALLPAPLLLAADAAQSAPSVPLGAPAARLASPGRPVSVRRAWRVIHDC
jgi:hypothetical protein